MIAVSKNVFAYQIAHGADRSLFPPRSLFLRRKAIASQNDEETIPVVHVNIVHRILKDGR
jgi:hypothetical protein